MTAQALNFPVPSALGSLENYIQAVNRFPLLSAEQEHDLAVRLRDENDLEAARQLVLSHLRLVVAIARGYLGYGLPHNRRSSPSDSLTLPWWCIPGRCCSTLSTRG